MNNFVEINKKLINEGVNLIDINNTYISPKTIIGKNVTIYPNVHIEGNCVIGDNCTILSGSFLIDCSIGNNTKVLASRISDSSIGANVELGPNSHLRNGCVIGDNCRIGNFVEMKNTRFGNNSKCAHLTYLGDASIGENVNIGCGVVTANYDGKSKHQTIIGDHSFIGSNCNLIAPIKIGSYVLLAAGSTISKDVLDNDMAIERSEQVIKKNFGYRYIKKEQTK